VIVHLATPEEWSTAQATGSVAPASLELEGFVHCSRADQVASTIDRHFAGVRSLVLLHLDEEVFGTDLRWEEGRPGEEFPHVYRAIALHEVRSVEPWSRAEGPPP
jgi:uncharacterized protein (DUF952 family)